MTFDIYNPYSNQAVTKCYVSVIERALNSLSFPTKQVTQLRRRKENSNHGIIVIAARDAIKAKLAGYKKVILWVQGAMAEESYMRHHSKMRYIVLSCMEAVGLRVADFILFVSQAEKEYYSKKLKLKLDNSYVMPCFNEEIDERFFKDQNRYRENRFVYAGGLSVWQCFEPTVRLYRKIEEQVPDAHFRVLVKDHEAAKRVLEQYGVKNYSLGFVPPEEVGAEMAKAKFGFCIRENNVVNRVATPTKLSNYISCGVMPIYSEYIEDFHSRAKKCSYCFCANPDFSETTVNEIVQACRTNFSPEDVYLCYRELFGEYYSAVSHIDKLSQVLRKLIAVNRG